MFFERTINAMVDLLLKIFEMLYLVAAKLFIKIRHYFYILLSSLYPILLASPEVIFKKTVLFYGIPSIFASSNSRIYFGHNVILCSDSAFTALSLSHCVRIHTIRAGAKIVIGDDSGLSGSTIISATSIEIGRECLIVADVTIIDTDFHPINPLNSRHNVDPDQIKTKAVVIGDNCFVGAKAIILKGTNIGSDSVVGAGSVVSSNNYPQGSIIVGNQARVVGFTHQAWLSTS